MDLRNTPSVDTRVIPSDQGPIDMKLRPDCIGKMVFENGAEQYGFGVQYRMDDRPATAIAGVGAGVGASYGGYGASALRRGGVMEEVYSHHRRTSQ